MNGTYLSFFFLYIVLRHSLSLALSLRGAFFPSLSTPYHNPTSFPTSWICSTHVISPIDHSSHNTPLSLIISFLLLFPFFSLLFLFSLFSFCSLLPTEHRSCATLSFPGLLLFHKTSPPPPSRPLQRRSVSPAALRWPTNSLTMWPSSTWCSPSSPSSSCPCRYTTGTSSWAT